MSDFLAEVETWPEPNATLKVIIPTTMTAITTISLILNTITAIVLVKVFKEQEKTSVFYILSLNLAICDLSKTIGQGMMIFRMYINWKFVFVLEKISRILFDMPFYAAIMFIFIIALNRWTIFCFPSLDSLIFQKRIVFCFLILFSWLLGLYMYSVGLSDCDWIYIEKIFYFYSICLDEIDPVNNFLFKKLNYVISYVIPILILPLYMATIYSIRKKLQATRGVTSRKNRGIGVEIRLTIQGVITWLLLVIMNLNYEFVTMNSELPQKWNWNHVIPYFLDIFFSIANSTCHPIIYILCDNNFRKHLKKTFGVRGDDSITVITISKTNI